ncbi:MAG: hypothetical protein SVW02_04190 [Candidatus Nanohaloarchaea archaeon]|nr:hypothetical protein [Candidatus Nanohaloarchaea archaeon]
MDALVPEVERNLELASSSKKLIDRERDMLQGEVEKRLVLHSFHTDAWTSLVNDGRIDDIDADTVQDCYMHLREVNELVDWFNKKGNRIAYVPLLERNLEGYGRKEVIEVLREKYDEAEMLLRETRQELEAVDL